MSARCRVSWLAAACRRRAGERGRPLRWSDESLAGGGEGGRGRDGEAAAPPDLGVGPLWVLRSHPGVAGVAVLQRASVEGW
eukprot:1181778-Prorocentrum_minimum.AAC.1